jgi:hypothetical protein
MSPHRRSYWKTVGAALFVAGLAAAALALLLRAAPSPAHLIELALSAISLGGSTLIAAGGLICLRRDRLEELGRPYWARRPRERRPGVLAAVIRALRPAAGGRLDLRPGDEVFVKPLDDILATLDALGRLDGLPFMPEMARLCGQRFHVHRRAEKVYDWVHAAGIRRLRDTVMLRDVRCDGAAHGGCQAGCQILWKEAWLQRAPVRPTPQARAPHHQVTAADLERLTQAPAASAAGPFVCQVTELLGATTPLAWGDPRHYMRDLLRGNVRLGAFLPGVSIALFNWVQHRRGGTGFPMISPTAQKSPSATLDLQPGELVRVKSKRAIEATLAPTMRNRGLWFDGDMLRYCGGEFRVTARVERLIDERSGMMIDLKNPCIVLDGVSGTGEYLAFGPQNDLILWREIWLERVNGTPQPTGVR